MMGVLVRIVLGVLSIVVLLLLGATPYALRYAASSPELLQG